MPAPYPDGITPSNVPYSNRVILDVHRQPLRLRIERGSLGDRPRQQHSLVLEAEVVVQVAGQVLLHAEEQALVRPGALRALGGELHVAGRFRRRAEVALLFVFFEDHFFSGGLRPPDPLTRFRLRAKRYGETSPKPWRRRARLTGPTLRLASRSRGSLAALTRCLNFTAGFALRDPDAPHRLGRRSAEREGGSRGSLTAFARIGLAFS